MCFSQSAPDYDTNPAPYSLEESHKAVDMEVSKDPKPAEQDAAPNPDAQPDNRQQLQVAGGSGAALRM